MIDFEIKHGGKYITRDGEVVFVVGDSVDYVYIHSARDATGGGYSVMKNGRWLSWYEDGRDIVAEYKEKDVDMTDDELKELVGEEVWCVAYGEGKIVKVHNCEGFYPIEVGFKNDINRTYTRDFKLSVRDERCLYFSKPTVVGDLLPTFKPKLIGKVVRVYSAETGTDMYVKVDDETKHAITYSMHGTGGYSVNKKNYTIELVDNG